MRLTEKFSDISIYYTRSLGKLLKISDDEADLFTNEAINKLGQLEDIEDELGIDLLTLFKALSGEYAVKEDNGRIVVEWSCPRFYAPACLGHGFDSWISIRNKENEKVLYLKDYGKTWALTKEELK